MDSNGRCDPWINVSNSHDVTDNSKFTRTSPFQFEKVAPMYPIRQQRPARNDVNKTVPVTNTSTRKPYTTAAADDVVPVTISTRDVHSVDSVDLSLRPPSARGQFITANAKVDDKNHLVTSSSSRELRNSERAQQEEDICLSIPLRIGIALLLAVLMGLVLTLCILLTIRPYKGVLY